MQKKVNIIIWGFVILLATGIGIAYFTKKNQFQLYKRNLFYMDTYIEVRIYSKDKEKAEQALDGVEAIYKEYHQLSDPYKKYDGLTNVHTIRYNRKRDAYLKIDKKLYQMIEYGLEWMEKSDGKLNIGLGQVIDCWKKYRELKNGVPSKEELEALKVDTEIILKDGDSILNNHPAIDLGSIAKGYATEEASAYLKKQGMTRFLINAGGNVEVGLSDSERKYKIGIEDPNTGGVFTIANVTNQSVVTSGGYERFYEYQGKKYHHIIHPETLYPADYMKSVTVITDNSKLGDILSTTLFLMPIDEGKKLVENMDGVEAIWYGKDDNITRSKGFKQYES
ncbi:MAG: FAD:protein FMN transferase [Firmicutes bacterium]|nr:FAD:protein FMN transferase [Bacillota bacterium]